MKQVTLEELLEAGCHFGHQVQRQNPKAREFIFEARDGIHIIDLAKTKEGLDAAAEFIKNLAAQGGSIIIVGTKRQAQQVVREEIARAKEAGVTGLFYVTNRWIGGTLTNHGEVIKNYRKLQDLEKMLHSADEKSKYTKREIGLFEKEKQKLEGFYGGIAELMEKPAALFVIDTHNEHLAVKEGRSENVPIVGIVDTNADPLIIDYPIPANDDAVGSLKLIITYIVDAWMEGRKASNKQEVKSDKKEEKSSAAKEEQKEKPAEKAQDKKKEVVKESNIVAKESTSETVATQVKKKAAPAKKVTGTASNT